MEVCLYTTIPYTKPLCALICLCSCALFLHHCEFSNPLCSKSKSYTKVPQVNIQFFASPVESYVVAIHTALLEVLHFIQQSSRHGDSCFGV